MIKNNKLTAMLFLFTLTLFFSGCVKKEFDKPPVGTLPVGEVYTISQLRQMYADSGAYMFNFDASVYAVVTMDESSGNIYKSAYIQDATDAVNLHKTGAGGLRVGDSIRVYLKNVVLSEYKGMFQLDNVNPDSNLIILATQKYREPELVTIPDLLTQNYQGKLIKLDSVQFNNADLGKSYADADLPANRTLEDCNGKTIVVRTSNYASFAETVLPEGRGNITAIVGQYNETKQLYIRSLSEVNLTGERCTGGGGGGGGGTITPVDEVDEHFDGAVDKENIAIDGWANIVVAGNRSWTGKTFNDNKYAQGTGYGSGLDDMETWLITPPVVNTSGDKKLSFKSAIAYWTHTGSHVPYTILASTDYDGSNFETANWTDITSMATLPDAGSSNYSWVESGEISLADFTGNVAIAFKYKGSDTESTSFTLDDVLISANGGGGGGGGDVLPSLNETFDEYADYDSINKGGWSDVMVDGNRAWIGKSYNDNKYAQATGYHSELDDMETWMITPLVDNSAGDKTLSFRTNMAHWAHTSNDPLEVYVSTDFDGTNFGSATWTQLSPTLPTSSNSNYEWVESGSIDLSSYIGNVAVAFKYKGSNTESTSIQVDDVVIE